MSDEIVRSDPEWDELRYFNNGNAFYYDWHGNPISLRQWVDLFDHTDRTVAKDTVTVDGKDLLVSTVYLGNNHQFGDGPPLIFETMVFGDHPLAEDACWRYATEDEARAHHEKVVRALRSARLTIESHPEMYPKAHHSDDETEA